MFDTTTLLRQAHTWAAQIAATKLGTHPAVVELQVLCADLAGLETLAFVRTISMRMISGVSSTIAGKAATDHGRPAPLAAYYDVVYSPVEAFWHQRMSIADADQLRALLSMCTKTWIAEANGFNKLPESKYICYCL